MKTFFKNLKDIAVGKSNNLPSFIKIPIDTVKGFIDDKGFEKASTLTFYSLLAIIPMIAIGFGIAQELGFEEKFSEQVKSFFQSQPDVADKIIEFSNATLKQTKGGVIATFGLIVLVWTAFRMIGNIAVFFDEIWKVKKERTMREQVKTYIPMLLFLPIFLVGSNSLIVLLATKAILATQSIGFLSWIGPFIKLILVVIPYALNLLLLTLLYVFLPNIKVGWKEGVIAAIATGIVYNVWQWIYVTFQLHASSYGAIYGGFAAVPLFLIWLNYSWLIILFGCELSSQIQKTSKKNEN